MSVFLSAVAVVPAQLFIIGWACWAAGQRPLPWYEFLGLATSVGVYTGGIGITVSHELSHKGTKLEQWLGRLLVVTVSYGCAHVFRGWFCTAAACTSLFSKF